MIKIGCAAYSYREYLKDGRMSYEDFIEEKVLETGGYNGFISVEYEEKEDPKIGVPRFARYLLNLFR